MLWQASEQARVSDPDKDESMQWGRLAAHLKLGDSCCQRSNVQDVVNALLLCETVYKVVDGGPELAARAINEIASHFGQLASLTGLQFALPHVTQQFLLAESKEALYVCFMGTKRLADVFVDVNLRQGRLWEDKDTEAPLAILAHRGFLSRAQGVPAEMLFLHARARRQRLVLCGHSLGGSVAMLCTLRLLRALTPCPAAPPISCIVFGSPAVGNTGLAKHVDDAGWAQHFTKFVLPEDVIPKMLVSARAAPHAQEATPAAETPAPAMQSVHSAAAPVQAAWPHLIAKWLLPGWTHFERPNGFDSVSMSNAPPDSTPTTAPRGDKILAAQEDSGGSNEQILTATGSLADESQQTNKSRWLRRSLQVLQDASALALSNIQQLLPSYPDLAHFAQHTYLRALPQDITLSAASRAARDTQCPQERNGFLLAMHRMPAYRQRLHSQIQAVAPGLLSQKPALDMSALPGNIITIISDLAPKLGPAQACARIPLLPPADASHSTIPTRLPKQHADAGAKQSAGSRFAWPQSLNGSGNKQQVQVLVSVSAEGWGLSSVTRVWAHTKGGLSFPARIIERPLQPVLSPAEALDRVVSHPLGAAWILPWSRQCAPATPNTNVGQIMHLHLVVELSLSAAQELISSQSRQDEKWLQIFLQSDYDLNAVAVKLQPHHVWLLAQPNADAGSALMQHLQGNSSRLQHSSAVMNSVISKQQRNGMPPSEVRGENEFQAKECSLAADMEDTVQPVRVAIPNQSSDLRSLPLALISIMRDGMQRLQSRAVHSACKEEILLQSYSAGIVFTAVGNPSGADLSSSCSLMESVLHLRLDRQRGKSRIFPYQVPAYLAAMKHCARLGGWHHWQQLRQQQQPDVLVILLRAAESGHACAGRDDQVRSNDVAAVRRLMQIAIPMGIDVQIMVGSGNNVHLDVDWEAECTVDGHKPAVEIIHSKGNYESEASAIHIAAFTMLRLRTHNGFAPIRAKL